MNYYYQQRGGCLQNIFGFLPTAIKNIIIINGIMLLAMYVFSHTYWYNSMALHPFGYGFMPWQLVTYMFMHGNFWHFFFNMYTLAMFGPVLEQTWGSKKFLIFYFVTGIGAALCHNLVVMLTGELALTVGASGSIYGILLGFAMLCPNAELRLLFFPFFPLKAKWFVLIFGALELVFGITGTQVGIAHFAHLGGMLFGWLLILYWKRKNRMYY